MMGEHLEASLEEVLTIFLLEETFKVMDRFHS